MNGVLDDLVREEVRDEHTEQDAVIGFRAHVKTGLIDRTSNRVVPDADQSDRP